MANGTFSPNEDSTALWPTILETQSTQAGLLTPPTRAFDADPLSTIDPILQNEPRPQPRNLENIGFTGADRHPPSEHGDGDGDDDNNFFASHTRKRLHLPSVNGNFEDSEFGGDFSSYSPPPSPSAPGPSRGKQNSMGQDMLSRERRKCCERPISNSRSNH